MIFKFIYNILIIFLLIAGIQCIVKFVINFLNKNCIKSVCDSLNGGNSKSKEDKQAYLKLKKECAKFNLDEKFKKEKTHLTTMLISIIEILIFSIITIILFIKSIELNIIFLILAKYAGGWIAIKMIGNYYKWSLFIIGRTSFYIFLIGSILNISLSIALGFYVYTLFFNS